MELSEEEKKLVVEMMECHLPPETISGLLLRRRAEPSQRGKALVWETYRKIWGDVLTFRELERRRHLEADSKRSPRREDRNRW